MTRATDDAALLRDFEATARDAARAGGRVVRAAFHSSAELQVERKAPSDYVTKVDRESERAIVGLLRER